MRMSDLYGGSRWSTTSFPLDWIKMIWSRPRPATYLCGQFLTAWLKKYWLLLPQKTSILIAWDEDDNTEQNRIANFLLGPYITPNTSCNLRLSHYSILKTIQDNWNLNSLERNDKNATTFLQLLKQPSIGDYLNTIRIISTLPNVSFPINESTYDAHQLKVQQEVLQQHNLYRARHCALALILNDVLTEIAQEYAEELAIQNQFQHSSNTVNGGKSLGENLYMMSGSETLNVNGATSTTDWYDEIKYYNFNRPGFSSGASHFTQVVWKDSIYLGVGVAYGNNGRLAYVVTNYYPAGNVQGDYQQNVLPEQC
ncbi:unnamed protein product [Didymodactylos carnosus]|uniref:SCP domain-containing protein n=1 Tax=Didymodactylos carnosus TaxID=1234261 RepID=A0A814DVJ9_9BILA|nr:unnamed protein product [Didymodactylos carnosus]CAF3735479.1 unnamed protein product [Didymodactylos carnosus]